MVAGRGRDGRRPRHPLPDRDRRRPAVVPGQPDRRARGLSDAVADELADGPRRPHAARRGRGGGGRGRGRRCPTTAPAPGLRRHAASGSTPTASRCRSPSSPGEGRVVLIDFWTYTCINCIRTLPYLEGVGRGVPRRRPHDRRRPLARVRVREGRRQRRRRDRRTTRSATRSSRTTSSAPGRAFGNQYWPAKYLIDADGEVRYVALRRGRVRGDRAGDPLAARRGGRHRARRRARARAGSSAPTRRCARPRPTWARRAPRAGSSPPQPGSKDYGAADAGVARPQRVRLRRDAGTSTTSRRRRSSGADDRRSRSRRAASSSCSASEDGPRELEVLLDGRPISDADAGEDVRGGVARRSTASASTGWSTCPRPGATR